MIHKVTTLCSAILLANLSNATRGVAEASERFIDLVSSERPAATLVAPVAVSPLLDAGLELIVAKCRAWGGAVPRIVRIAPDDPVPQGDVIWLATPDASAPLHALVESTDGPLSRIGLMAPDGFAIESRTTASGKQLVLAAQTLRGVYNAACYCRDFLLDATPASEGKPTVYVHAASEVRAPQIAARGTYHLSIYGAATQYGAEDWMRIVDRYAEDGMNRVYFWLSGYHPSTKYPQLHVCKDSKLTVDGVSRLIRYCHDRDIEFYIGGGVFAWIASHYLLTDHPEIAAVDAGGLCPSHEFARTGNREHFLEMLATWPEADGFMFEVRDEHGECRCPKCRVQLDGFGSKGYGQAEITWLQEFARGAWKQNPNLKICWLIGYAEHANDVKFYEQIRQMNDPRFEWLDSRVGLDPTSSWLLPGPQGEKRPLAFFGPRISHWDQFYRQPIENIRRFAERTRSDGLYGYIPAFEPGFGTASYYGDQVPFPVDILPYCLTGFVYRETTWDPGIGTAELHDRIQRRYFSSDSPKRLGEDLAYLHQFSIDYAEVIKTFATGRLGYSGERIAL